MRVWRIGIENALHFYRPSKSVVQVNLFLVNLFLKEFLRIWKNSPNGLLFSQQPKYRHHINKKTLLNYNTKVYLWGETEKKYRPK